MRFGSLFSGIGGLDLGLERAGMECAWQVEIDEYCQRVLKKHWPDVPKFRDVKELDGRELERLGRVDLVCGGFPCQPVSEAGRRQAQADERWLWPEFARVIRLVRPGYILVENVPGLLSRGMGDVLGDLSSLGYDAEWESIPAFAVGAPHVRYRVFIVAYAQRPQWGQGKPARHDTYGTGARWPQEASGLGASGENGGAGHLAYAHSGYGYGWGSDVQVGRFALAGTTAPDGNVGRTQWGVEPNVGRVAHGVPQRVERLRGLGNAVVPQVAEWIGQRILEADSTLTGKRESA